MSSAGDGEAIGTAGEIAGIDLVAAQVFDFAKASLGKIAGERSGVEEKLEGFSGEGHPGRKRIERELLQRSEKRPVDREVECNTSSRRQPRDELHRPIECRPRKIGSDAEPGEESARVAAKAGSRQLIGQGLALEIDRGERQGAGNADSCVAEPLPLPFLGSRMIDLDDAESGGFERIAIGEGVESSAEHDVLPDTALDGAGKLILRVAAAYGNECPQGARERMRGGGGRFGFGAGNRGGERVLEYQRPIENLVGRAPHRHPLSGPARLHVLRKWALRTQCTTPRK